MLYQFVIDFPTSWYYITKMLCVCNFSKFSQLLSMFLNSTPQEMIKFRYKPDDSIDCNKKWHKEIKKGAVKKQSVSDTNEQINVF